MARKRNPVTIEGQSVVLDAPGLEFRRGTKQAYWKASAEARRKGYTPEMVSLQFDLTTLDGAHQIERRCHDLTNEMLEWIGKPEISEQVVYNGTITSLSRCYQKDPRSPFHGLRQNTRRTYLDACRALEHVAGWRVIDKMNGQDVREIFMELLKGTKRTKGAPRVRHAKAVVREMLPTLLNYGAEAKLPGCLALAQIMDRMTLRVPAETRKAWKASLTPKVAMGYVQAEAIVAEGLRLYETTGLKRWRSVALGVAAQFEFTLRQIDVIGEFEEIRPGTVIPANTIVRLGKTWRPGLWFEQFAGEQLDVETSKNATQAPFDPSEYPLFMRALNSVPVAERVGPLVVGDDGLPMFKRFYSDVYDELRTAANVPKAVWNMRARHGGLTEGYDAIVEQDPKASLDDLRFHGQHADLDTTLDNYVVSGVRATRRVARARVATRPRKESA